MKTREKKDLFEFMIDRITEVASEHAETAEQAFPRWFAHLYTHGPRDIFSSDGPHDGKIDMFFKADEDETIKHYVINSKFTRQYDKIAPNSFYDEVLRFQNAFKNPGKRAAFLKACRNDVKNRYRNLLTGFDDGNAKLLFVTNHKRNPKQVPSIVTTDIELIHLEELVQFMADDLEGAMPKTPPLYLCGIDSILSPSKNDTRIPTSIVFARLIDLIKYMEKDPFELLFARNVRLSLGNTEVNKEITQTYLKAPQEFVFSNNGLTMLCEKHSHDPGAKELTVLNPRIVNGSQTLHSVQNAEKDSPNARVMLRIIQVPKLDPDDTSKSAKKRKDIIHKISTRSNRQNQIKKWDLVSNDDYQNELARHFRKHKYYYERRTKEWSHRRTELKASGIRRGPEIKGLTQYIASYHWYLEDELGPAKAHASVGSLFDESAYQLVMTTDVKVAYQVFLLSSIVKKVHKNVKNLKWVAIYGNYVKLTLFSVVARAFDAAEVDWGSDALGKLLEQEKEKTSTPWNDLVKGSLKHIKNFHVVEVKRYKKENDDELKISNYFKSNAIDDIFFADPLAKLTHLAKKIVGENQ